MIRTFLHTRQARANSATGLISDREQVRAPRGPVKLAKVQPRVLGEPSLHFLGLVSLVVVADRVHVEMLRYGPVDRFQEANELLDAVTWQALALGNPINVSEH
jgi:hypothetical protein